MHYKGNQENDIHFTGHASPFKEKSGQNWTKLIVRFRGQRPWP